jgi:hypothetical protein
VILDLVSKIRQLGENFIVLNRLWQRTSSRCYSRRSISLFSIAYCSILWWSMLFIIFSLSLLPYALYEEEE